MEKWKKDRGMGVGRNIEELEETEGWKKVGGIESDVNSSSVF